MYKRQLPCIAELQPVPPAQANYLDVVPTLNRLSTKGHTEIMIANNQCNPITIKAGLAVATANINDISWINKEDTTLEQITITHADDQEELNSIEQTVDSNEHKSKLLSDSAILNTDPIPQEHDITKRKPTISDKELLEKFHLDHLEPPLRTRVKKLILQYRPIWSEHPFDLGLHKYIKHNIVLTADLPPCLSLIHI